MLGWDPGAGTQLQPPPKGPRTATPAQSCLWGLLSYWPSQGHEPAPGCTARWTKTLGLLV